MGLVEDLSAAFVAFTIEVDDAAEARLAHRTTRGPGSSGRGGAWLVSLAMWENCMRWLPEEGMTVAELVATARTETDLAGMVRWGYVTVEGLARATPRRPRQGAMVRPTRRGLAAQGVWDGLPDEVERRWGERFGVDAVADLRDSLVALAGPTGAAAPHSPTPPEPDAAHGSLAHVSGLQQPKDAACLDGTLPDTMPIVRHGWRTRREGEPERRPGPVAVYDLDLHSLLARPLTASALEFEASGKLSLALHANLLTVLGPEPIPLRDLPDLTGIAREQIDNAVGYLERAGLAEVAPTPGARRGQAVPPTAGAKPGKGVAPTAGAKRGKAVALTAGAKRGKAVALTTSGTRAKAGGARKLAALEATWDERHGPTLTRVREALAPLVADDDPSPPAPFAGSDGPAVSAGVRADAATGADRFPLLASLEHPPGTWRAEARPLARLPRFPLVTHRGGFPDGS